VTNHQKNSTSRAGRRRKRNHAEKARAGNALRNPPPLSDDEERLLARPEIPIESWREGKRLFDRKLARLTAHEHGRLPKWTREIKSKFAELRKRIANDPQLVKDFEFFTQRMSWPAEEFLFHLFWDCNVSRASPQAVIADDRRQRWPLNRKELDALCSRLLKIAAILGKLDGTELSPAYDLSPSQIRGFYEDEARRLPAAQRRFLLRAFRGLPALLRLYSKELRGNVLAATEQHGKSDRRMQLLVRHVRQTSLYETIRSTLGGYHSTRLCRLVNAARAAQSLPIIKPRAFDVWLNRFQKRRPTSLAEGG